MQSSQLKRRKFLTVLGGAAAWPLAARAQQPAMPTVGFLHARAPEVSVAQVEAFRRALGEEGYVDGQNLRIEFRWARGQYDQLPAMAAELARRPVDLLIGGSEPAALAAKAATSTIPIVFAVGSDPIKLGLVASFNRPGGNVTGIDILTTDLNAKRLGLLHEVLPRAETIGVLLNSNSPVVQTQLGDVQAAAGALSLRIREFHASSAADIDAAFERIAHERITALLVQADPFFDTRRDQLVANASRAALPVMFQFREYAMAGGLMSYGVDLPDMYRQVGAYAGRILKGDKPAELPVLQPSKLELVLNLKTAKALGLTIPPGVLAIADEVIE
jgi:putative tryptophan/tyrosine transport system substrate-binding protein